MNELVGMRYVKIDIDRCGNFDLRGFKATSRKEKDK